MFKQILWLVPKIDSKDLNNMERTLGTRFTKLAKRFGKGMVAALSGGGIAGLALGLVDKLLNPLKETQEAIDKTLKQGDDLVTNAKQFGTSAGKLFRLQQLGKSTGLEEGSLNLLLEKFQTAVAEAAQDPNKETSVRAFVGNTDTASAFFEFVQSLQKMEKNQQLLVQKEVFGEKQILKMAEFLQTDFGAQQKLIGGPSADQLTPSLEKLAGLSDLTDALEARRTLEDTAAKAAIINEGVVRSRDTQLRQEQERENKQIKSYDDLAAIAVSSTALLDLGKEAILKVTSMLVKVTNLADFAARISGSRAARGVQGGKKK